MFLWGIDGQIWADLWATFNHKQLRKLIRLQLISEVYGATLLFI